MSAIRPFHLAIPVHDLEVAREFYGDILGCSTGRESENWIPDSGNRLDSGHRIPDSGNRFRLESGIQFLG